MITTVQSQMLYLTITNSTADYFETDVVDQKAVAEGDDGYQAGGVLIMNLFLSIDRESCDDDLERFC